MICLPRETWKHLPPGIGNPLYLIAYRYIIKNRKVFPISPHIQLTPSLSVSRNHNIGKTLELITSCVLAQWHYQRISTIKWKRQILDSRGAYPHQAAGPEGSMTSNHRWEATNISWWLINEQAGIQASVMLDAMESWSISSVLLKFLYFAGYDLTRQVYTHTRLRLRLHMPSCLSTTSCTLLCNAILESTTTRRWYDGYDGHDAQRRVGLHGPHP